MTFTSFLLSSVGSGDLSLLICVADDLMNEQPNQNKDDTSSEFDL